MTAPARQLSFLDEFVPPAPGDPVFDQLVEIALELSLRTEIVGATVGEVVEAYETRTKKVLGGIPMLNPIKEQRQTSWLPRVMWAANLRPTDAVRRSPVKRHHRHRHSVWVPSGERENE